MVLGGYPAGEMSLALRIGLLVATLLLLLLLGEGVARVLAALDTPTEPDPALAGLPELVDVMSLGEPNLDGVHRGVRYRTNAHGLRGPDHAPEPAPGTFRVLVGGDSVTAGWAVPEDRSYPRVLERLLNESPPAAARAAGVERFEVINLGLAGINARFTSERLWKYAAIYHPQLTVYGFTLNDIQGPRYRELSRAGEDPAWDALWRRALRFQDSPSALLRAVWPRLVMLLEWDAFHPSESDRIGPMGAELMQNYFENPAAWGAFEAALDRQAQLAAARGRCAHLLVHTHLGELTPEHRFLPIYARVEEAARRRGIGVTQSLPDFLGRDPRALWVNEFDVHPNVEGHALLARALHRGLQALPARCWTGTLAGAADSGSSASSGSSAYYSGAAASAPGAVSFGADVGSSSR